MSWLAILAALPGVVPCRYLEAQKLNPPYLGEMPTVARVLREMQGKDAQDTAERQMGAFWQLRQILYDLALSQHRNRNNVTPDESRIADAYDVAYSETRLKAKVTRGGYDVDPEFRHELFQKFFSPAFQAEYAKANAIFAQRHEEYLRREKAAQARIDGRAKSSEGAAQPGKGEEPMGFDKLIQAASDLFKSANTQSQTTQAGAAAKPLSAAEAQAATNESKTGQAYLRSNDYARAVEHFNKSIAIGPSSAAYTGLGSAYYGLKQYPQSVEAYKQAIRLAPNVAELHLWLAQAYDSHGRTLVTGPSASRDLKPFENAEAETREAIRLKPDYQEAYFTLGGAAFLQMKYPEALAALQQAIRLKADDQNSLYLLSLSYASLGKKEESMRVQQRLATLNKEYAQELLTAVNKRLAAGPAVTIASFNEGQKHFNAMDYAKAVESFHKAITLTPDVPTLANIHAWLAASYRELKQYPNAIAAAKESLRLRPNYADTILGLGRSYYLAGQHQNALATFQEALRLNPEDAETQHWIGEVYFYGLKQPENALLAYRGSLNLKPNDPRTINQTGIVYTELEQFSEAVNAYKEAIRLKPEIGLYHSNLGLTYVEMGMKEEAIAVQQTLQKIDSAKAKELGEQINVTFSDEDDPKSLLAYAAFTSVMAHPKAALPVYRRVLLLKPEPGSAATAYREMGDIYTAEKNEAKATAAYQQALVVYQRLLRARPQEVHLVYGLGHTYLGLGQKDQAMQVQRRLMALDKKSAQDLFDEINKSSQEAASASSTGLPASEGGRRSRPARGQPPGQTPQETPSVTTQPNPSHVVKYAEYDELIYGGIVHSAALLFNTMSAAPSDPALANGPPRVPSGAEAYLLQGDRFRKDYQFVKALESYKQVVALKPDSEALARAYLGMALADLRISGQNEKAIFALRESLRLQPDYFDANLALGVIYCTSVKYQNALQAIHQAVRLKPNDATAQHWLGWVYLYGLEQYDKAVPAYREAVRLKPDNLNALSELGVAYLYLKQHSNAVTTFKQAIGIKADNVDAHWWLAISYINMGRKEDALQVYRTLERVDKHLAGELLQAINKMS